MLLKLYIENIAVIEKAEINFHSGLNVLTGETGAGKSIVIDSINAILGERMTRDIVRTGAKSAYVTAVFTHVGTQALDKVYELGFSQEDDGSIMIQREIHSDGKSVCRINSRPATVSALKKIGSFLISIHGQHENYSLLSSDLHIKYIDRLGVPSKIMHEYSDAYNNMKKARNTLESYNIDEFQKARQIDLLTYQINELEAANLHPGEQDELNKIRTRYLNSEKIIKSINDASCALDGDDNYAGALSAVAAAADALCNVEKYIPDIHDLCERMHSIQYDLEDCSQELGGYSSQLEYDPVELEKIEVRLDSIYRLSLKYGGTVDKMLDFLDNCKLQLNEIQLSDKKVSELSQMYEDLKKKANIIAKDISEKRRKTSAVFKQRVKEELKFLDMPNIDFEIKQEDCPLNSLGCDKLEFLISTNAGEPPKALAKIASGGELSRIMLAIKTVLAGKDDINTLIFDEIDTGISGSAAQKVGLKLHEVANNRQVICVTHLAQIAALADTQYLIKKQVANNKTYTNVEELDYDGRKNELARIMGGTKITPLLLENAAEMLKMAQNGNNT